MTTKKPQKKPQWEHYDAAAQAAGIRELNAHFQKTNKDPNYNGDWFLGGPSQTAAVAVLGIKRSTPR